MTAEPTTPTSKEVDTHQEHSEGQEADPTPEPLPLDLTFEILKNKRRRLVLKRLKEVDGETTIGELAEHIAAIENDCTVQALGAQQRKRVYIGLYQCHLPKMDDADVIDFNQSRGRVELNFEAEPLYEYLVTEDETESDASDEAAVDPRPYAIGTAGVGVAFGAAQFMGQHLLASLLVFGFLGAVLVFGLREFPNDDAETDG